MARFAVADRISLQSCHAASATVACIRTSRNSAVFKLSVDCHAFVTPTQATARKVIIRACQAPQGYILTTKYRLPQREQHPIDPLQGLGGRANVGYLKVRFLRETDCVSAKNPIIRAASAILPESVKNSLFHLSFNLAPR